MTTVRAWRREEFTSSTEKHPEAPEESERYLGRAILLAYRFSGGVPAVLASARLLIKPDSVRLEVAAAKD